MKCLAQRTDIAPGLFSSAQQLLRRLRSSAGAILILDAMAAALLPQVLAQQLPGERIDQPDVRGIPLDPNTTPDPARRRAIVSGFDFHAAVQVNGAFAVLVIAKRFEWQREQRRPSLR